MAVAAAMTHPVPVLIVAAAMAFLAAVAFRSWTRSGTRYLLFVGFAFSTFALKNCIVAYGLLSGWPAHEDLELVGTALDLVVAGLLIVPLLLRR